MDIADNLIFSKIETLHEVQATNAEKHVEDMNALVSLLNTGDLSGDQKASLSQWHRAAQESAKNIREFN